MKEASRSVFQRLL